MFALFMLLVFCVGVACMFLCACVAPDDPTLLGTIARTITSTVPTQIERAVRAVPVLGPLIIDGSVATFNWAVFKPNPLLQIVYAVLVFGGYGVVVYSAYPRIPNDYMAGYHRWIGVFVVGGTVWAWYKACSVSPGYITHENWRSFDNYKIDGLMYQPDEWYNYKKEDEKAGRPVRPNVPKLPRSKNDAFTGKVVSRFDHFCPWLNNPVGERNYRYFLLFLFMTALMLAYGTAATLSVVASFINEHHLFEARYVNKKTGKVVTASTRMVFHYCMHKEQYMMMLLFLCGIMGLVVMAFLCYHLWLVSQNRTTNEGFKWSRAQSRWRYLERERVTELHSKAQEQGKEEEEKEEEEAEAEASAVGGAEVASAGEKKQTQPQIQKKKKKKKNTIKQRKNKRRCPPAFLKSYIDMWANGIYLLTCGVLGFPMLTPSEREERESKRWREKQNPSFAVQPCPPYPYQLGSFWLNLSEVFWPRSEQNDGGDSRPTEGGWDDRHEGKRRNIVRSEKKELKKEK